MDLPISSPDSDSEAFDTEDDEVIAEWKQLFEELTQLLSDSERNKEVANLERAEYICEHIKNAVLTIGRLYTLVLDYICDNPVCEIVSELLDKLSTLEEQLSSVELPYWQHKVGILSASLEVDVVTPPTIHHDHQRGRPPFDVDTEQIVCLREIGFTWKEVSTMLGISRMTLYRKRKQAGIVDERYCNVDSTKCEHAHFAQCLNTLLLTSLILQGP